MKIDIMKKIEEIHLGMEKVQRLKDNILVWEPFVKDLQVRLSWNSNSLEGNTLSLDETIAVIEYDEVRSGHTYTEYQEAKNMYKAVCEKLNLNGCKSIDNEWLQDVNSVIMQNDGCFRHEDVYIGSLAEVIYYPPSFSKVPELMKDFESDLIKDDKMSVKDIVSHVARKHVEFERIHPFLDGNGRTGRILMNQQFINNGILPAVIKDQSKYRQAFRRYDRTGDLSLMEYSLADGVLQSYQKLEEILQKYNSRMS